MLRNPEPWTCKQAGDHWQIDANGVCIAAKLTEANARYAVLAVNSRADLLAALKLVQKESQGTFEANHFYQTNCAAVVNLAIRKAEGR